MPKDQVDLGPQFPRKQSCAKCGAEFRWEPSDAKVQGSPLVARVVTPSPTCDCGYGRAPERPKRGR